MFENKAHVRCVDCGYCGFHINLGHGLKWEEMTQELRTAYDENKDKQPPGQVPGTGHWNFIECVLSPHSIWPTSVDSQIELRSLLINTRICKQYFRYHAGFTAPEHHTLESSRADLYLKQWNTWIAIVALTVAIISLAFTLSRC